MGMGMTGKKKLKVGDWLRMWLMRVPCVVLPREYLVRCVEARGSFEARLGGEEGREVVRAVPND